MKERVSKIAQHPEALPSPQEVSELLREYAQPLLYADPEGPTDIDTIRTAMMLAMICWNLPVYEASGSPLFEQGTRTLEKVMKNVPSVVAARLQRLVEERKTKFGDYAFLALVEVEGTTLQNAKIVAQAKLPRPKA